VIAGWALAALLAGDGAIADELARLVGQRVEVTEGAYSIEDIAGEGPPIVGTVCRDADALVLVSGRGRERLIGPLARPRIAGPGYRVWVIGTATADRALRARRLGVLAPPSRTGSGSASTASSPSNPCETTPPGSQSR